MPFTHHSPFGEFFMNTATANLIILTADVNGDNILGTALDGDIAVLFAVTASEVNRRLFVPAANLVVTGKFRLGREVCSIGISIKSIVAVISLPVAASSEVAIPSEVTIVEPVAVPSEAPAEKRKTSTTRSKKQAAKTELAAA